LVYRPEIRGEPNTSKKIFGVSMSLRARLRAWMRPPPPVSLTFHVEKESESFTADDGSILWASGYMPVDATTGKFMKLRDQHFENPHCLLSRVAGVTYRPDALQDDRFSPGRRVILRPEPTNRYDQNAVGVWDASGSIRLGFVPREYSERIATDIASRIALEGLTLREFRRTPSGPRLGIHILIFPAGRHQIVIDVDHDAVTDTDTDNEQSNSQPSAWLTR
jgi:HIRAN domain